ncbi:DUF962 domain-containing protein [Shewanella acanthi]|uniref:DUF962 domain-containing protein n=1 Tax=Shewanella acanthi TaxID=2864212 RepID=UPI001C656876|nr:DUF962 domain-containing protein [Shewanella acanthi]QYJ77828.1 DUF962 domain-containing protein [Shewanella acanthi]
MNERYKTFAEFYPFYLSQHQNKTCRWLHVLGSGLVLFILIAAIVTQASWLYWLMPIAGYGFAWIGHFVFEHNRPATFKYPIYSLMGDWVMFVQILTGKLTSHKSNSLKHKD